VSFTDFYVWKINPDDLTETKVLGSGVQAPGTDDMEAPRLHLMNIVGLEFDPEESIYITPISEIIQFVN
jgi:hypothetical protein